MGLGPVSSSRQACLLGSNRRYSAPSPPTIRFESNRPYRTSAAQAPLIITSQATHINASGRAPNPRRRHGRRRLVPLQQRRVRGQHPLPRGARRSSARRARRSAPWSRSAWPRTRAPPAPPGLRLRRVPRRRDRPQRLPQPARPGPPRTPPPRGPGAAARGGGRGHPRRRRRRRGAPARGRRAPGPAAP